ncbi:coil containing protein [Vibrio phage 1.079.O._10N.286.45.E9]|nr:coil containing protein [Vibrio phage 1.079.O._10N.286.45.E9]
MSDLENIVDTEVKNDQPVEVVATDAEEVNQPQVNDTDDTELYVESEGDQEQPKTNMSQEQAYAAFRKEKEKRQRKNEELEASQKREQELADRLARLESSVGTITKGAPPSLESCDYDEEVYQKAVREYYSPTQSTVENKPEQKPQDNQSNPALDEAEFYLYQSEQELSKQLPDYEQNKSELVAKMKSQYGATDSTMIQFAMIAKQAGADIAKANVALNKNPTLLAELSQACTTGNQFAIADVLKKAAAKVQTRQRNPIDTQPEPTINSSGPIDNHAKAVDKARTDWVNASGSDKMQKWKQYQAIKNTNK